MFQEDMEFIVHKADASCPPHQEKEEEEEQDQHDDEEDPVVDTDHLEELLNDFPWGKKAKRLLHCILQQQHDSVSDDYAIIDLLKFCCTPDNKFNKTDDTHRRKIIATLKKFKASGMNIPQAFLTRACVKKMF